MDSTDQLLEHCVSQALTSTPPHRVAQLPAAVPAHADVQILLPVFNATDALAVCLASVLQHTPADIPIVLLDDASDDATTMSLLQQAVDQHPHRCQLHRRAHNLGFVGNVNAALKECAGDVVVLNSDTVVHARWLQHLQQAAAAEDNIGVVCPVSDNATLLTVADSPLLADCSSAQIAGFCEQCAGDEVIELPTAVGFCMYLRQHTVRRIGLLDTAFAPGYGEEVDYSLRARSEGLRIVVAPRCFVSHQGAASFGDDDEIRARRHLHEQMVHQRWPEYVQEVRNWWRDNPLLELREALKNCAIKHRTGCCRRVLHITHNVESIGGTEVFVDGLLQRISAEFPATLVCVGKGRGWADQFTLASHSKLEVIKLNADYRVVNQSVQSQPADLSNPWLERYFTRLLREGDFAMVHVHYLLGWDTLLLPLLAKRLGLPVVISLHCHYHLCPDYNMLLRPDLVPCQQPYAGASDSCVECLQPRYQSRPSINVPPLQTYLQARRRFSTRALQAADAIVVPSQYLAGAIADGLDPQLIENIQVIAHGIELEDGHNPASAESHKSPSQTLQILFCGGDYPLKGYDLLLQLIDFAQQHALDVHFHIAGECRDAPADLPRMVTVHDGLAHDVLLRLMQQMDLLLLPSRYLESFSILLSEAWASGVVPLASAHGALADRISDTVDGFLLPPFDASKWQQKLTWLSSAEGRFTLVTMRNRLRQQAHRNMDECAADYLHLYRRLMPSAVAQQHNPQIRKTQTTGKARQMTTPVAANSMALHPPLPELDAALLPELIVLIDCTRNAAHRLVQTLACVRELADAILLISNDSTKPLLVEGEQPTLAITEVSEVAALQGLIKLHPAAWLVWVESGDLLQASCRHRLVAAAQRPAEVIYCNHDHVSANGQYYSPALKPDHDQALLQYLPLLQHGLFMRANFWVRAGMTSLQQAQALAVAHKTMLEHAQQVLHLPQILYHRLDQNIALDCRDDARLIMLQALQQHGLVAAASIEPVAAIGMGWSLQHTLSRPLRVHVCRWQRSAQSDDPRAAHWQTLVDDHAKDMVLTLETVAPGSLPTLANLAELDYLLHVHDGIVALKHDTLHALLAYAEQHQATATAPQLRLASGAPLPIAYSACSTGLYRSLPRNNVQHGLHALAFARPASLHADVLADCVLLNFQHFQPVGSNNSELTAAKKLLQQWPQLAVSARLAAYPKDCNALAVGAVTVTTASAPEPLQSQRDKLPPALRYLRDPWRWHVESAGRGGKSAETSNCSSRRYRRPGKLPVLASVISNAWAAAQYRVMQPARELLAEQSIDQHHCHQLDQQAAPDAYTLGLLQTDVLLCLHWLDDHALQQLQLARQRLPLRIVLLIDDLLTDLPDYNPYAKRIPRDVGARLQQAAALADRIIVSSAGLAQAFAGLHRDVRVINNALPEKPWLKLGQQALARRAIDSDRGERKLRVGWAGGAQHDGDLAILEPVMRATAASIDWILLGHCPPSLHSLLAEHRPAVAFNDYPQALADLQLDVAVAPLQDNPFNRCKSMLKILEYAALELPVIASRVGSYVDTPALAVGNSNNDWIEAIMHYHENTVACQQHGKQMQAWVSKQHLLQQCLPKWQDALCRWD